MNDDYYRGKDRGDLEGFRYEDHPRDDTLRRAPFKKDLKREGNFFLLQYLTEQQKSPHTKDILRKIKPVEGYIIL